jgi:TM2 domain-containing membrane protein YozV
MAKNAILAAILSFLIPGLGEIYVGKLIIGIILVVIAIILTAAIYTVSVYAWILYIIIWLYAIYDSYTSAKATQESPKVTE